jgi:toxin YoeB
MRALKFDSETWDDYVYWQVTDKAIVKRINGLIKEGLREPYEGTGKPEPLKHMLAGWWSRRITEEHRMVYRLAGDTIEIAKLRYHY